MDGRRLAEDRRARLDEREARQAVDEATWRRAAVAAVDVPSVAAWRRGERARLDRERIRLDADAARLTPRGAA